MTVVRDAAYWKEMRRRSAANKEARGECRHCPNPRAPGRTQCPDCLLKANIRRKDRYAQRVEDKACVYGGCPIPVAEGRVYCEAHLAANREAVKRHRADG